MLDKLHDTAEKVETSAVAQAVKAFLADYDQELSRFNFERVRACVDGFFQQMTRECYFILETEQELKFYEVMDPRTVGERMNDEIITKAFLMSIDMAEDILGEHQVRPIIPTVEGLVKNAIRIELDNMNDHRQELVQMLENM